LAVLSLFSIKSQAQNLFSKSIIKSVCYLDGEIIYDPEASITMQALERINPRDINIRHFIKEDVALKLYGSQGKYGVYLLYSKNDPAAIQRDRSIIAKFCSDYQVSPYLAMKNKYPADSILDCTNPAPGEIPPEFPGGVSALQKFISDRLKLPEDARQNSIMGRVTVGFIVRQSGVVTDMQAVYGKRLGCNLASEAVKILSDLPRLYPATLNGKPHDAYYSLTISYKITDQDSNSNLNQ